MQSILLVNPWSYDLVFIVIRKVFTLILLIIFIKMCKFKPILYIVQIQTYFVHWTLSSRV